MHILLEGEFLVHASATGDERRKPLNRVSVYNPRRMGGVQ